MTPEAEHPDVWDRIGSAIAIGFQWICGFVAVGAVLAASLGWLR